jgi:hypothetical protein
VTRLAATPFSRIAYYYLLFFQLFDLIAVLDLVHENFGRLKTGDIMFIDYQGRVPGNVSGNLFLSLLVNKAAKSTDVDVIAI